MKKRHLFIVCATLVTFFACLKPGVAAESHYTASAMFVIRPQAPTVMENAKRDYSEDEFIIYKKTQRLMLVSRFVLSCALRKPEIAKIPSVREHIREGDAVRWLGEIIKVQFPDDAEIMSVTCTQNDPAEAQAILKAVVGVYLSEVVNFDRDSRNKRIFELERIANARESYLRILDEKERQLSSLISPRTKYSDSSSNKSTVDVEKIQFDLGRLRSKIRILENVLNEVNTELERQRIELAVPSRVIQVGPIERPQLPD